MPFPPRPAGITALSLFFVFGTVMSGLTTAMLLFPGSALDLLWRLNPRAQQGFAAMGAWAVLLMVIVCAACATGAVGLWRLTRVGFWTALIVLAVNLLSDTANAFIASDWRSLIGVPIAGFMIGYLLKQRRMFHH